MEGMKKNGRREKDEGKWMQEKGSWKEMERSRCREFYGEKMMEGNERGKFNEDNGGG